MLGALIVRGPDGEAAIPRGRASSLLEWLVAHRAGGVTVDATMASLWPASTPSDSRDALRGYLSRLRRQLPDDDLIVRLPGDRLGIDIDLVEVDVDRFDVDSSRGFDHLAGGHPEAALGHLDRALSLWRGHPYQSLDDTSVGIAESVRLGRLRDDGEVARCAAWIATDRSARAVPLLDKVVRREPARERAWRMLIVALAGAGSRTDATRAFQRCRAALAQLDEDPAPETVALDRRLIAGDRLDAQTLVHREYAGQGDGHPPAPLPDNPSVPGPRTVIAVTDDLASSVDRLRALAGPGPLVLDLAPAPTPPGGPLEPLAAAVEESVGDDLPDLDDTLRRLRAWPAGDLDDERTSAVRIDCLAATTEVIETLVRRRPVWTVVPDAVGADPTLVSTLRHVASTLPPCALVVVLVATAESSRWVITATDEVLALD